MSITVKFLTAREISVPLDGGTMREWLIRHDGLFPPPTSISNNSFIWKLCKKGGTVNTFESRHRPVTELLADGDVLYALLWQLGHDERCKNNLLASHLSYDTGCAVCWEEFASDTRAISVALNCGHRFHVHCLWTLRQAACPVCRAATEPHLFCRPTCSCCQCPCDKCAIQPLSTHM
jgi:hypothetical protein